MDRFISLLALICFFISCNENFHIGSEDLVDPVVTVELPVQVFPTETYNLSGDCSPNRATVTLTSSEMNPIEVSCDCNSSRYICPAVTFPASSGSTAPEVTAQIEDSLGQRGEGADETELVVAQIELAEFSAPVEVGDPVTIQGSCAPVGANISITIPSELTLSSGTSPVACTCAPDGTFNLSGAECGSITVTANTLSSAAVIGATVSDSGGNTASDSDDLEIICSTSPPTTFSNRMPFNHTGADQFFDISALDSSVCWLRIKAWGAGGGGSLNSGADGQGFGGGGGFAESFIERADINSELLVVVGSGGNEYNVVAPAAIYGGGGRGGQVGFQGSSGGGLSGVFDASSFSTALQQDSILVAGAGAGVGRDDIHIGNNFFPSGVTDAPAGGGLVGQDGLDSPFDTNVRAGRGGTQTAGGESDTVSNAADGSALQGGDGGNGPSCDQGGGGGGSGYFGGGGGGCRGSIREAPGGGGSSFISILDSGDGQTISGHFRTPANTTDVDYLPGIGAGGAAHTAGGNGFVVIEWE